VTTKNATKLKSSTGSLTSIISMAKFAGWVRLTKTESGEIYRVIADHQGIFCATGFV